MHFSCIFFPLINQTKRDEALMKMQPKHKRRVFAPPKRHVIGFGVQMKGTSGVLRSWWQSETAKSRCSNSLSTVIFTKESAGWVVLCEATQSSISTMFTHDKKVEHNAPDKRVYKFRGKPYPLVCCMQMTCLCERIERFFPCPFLVWDIALLHLMPLDRGNPDDRVPVLPFFFFGPEWFPLGVGVGGWSKFTKWTVLKNTLLVFIFILYISLNVQCVSCSTVKYIYIMNAYQYISHLIWFVLC